MKYVLVTGGVISGVGKGVISSSIGATLKACGLNVTSIKIDPYINVDAGTFSPYEHGEVFVLEDGGEVDLDLGNYERFLDVELHRDNNITTGKIYQDVIEKERRGEYLGQTVQVVPHITNAIQDWIQRVSLKPVVKTGNTPDICVIELGGVVGDIEGMPYVEAMRQFQFRVGLENICFCHVSLIPETTSGELKSKPTQMSIRQLRGFGLTPDLILARSRTGIDDSLKQKISMFCNVGPSQVLSVPDVSCVYRVPNLLYKQGLVKYIINKLNLDIPEINPRSFLYHWKQLAERYDHPYEEVKIAIVGKYTKLEDAYMSVIKALKHSALACKRRLSIKWVEAENLEETAREKDPVIYHEAWQGLCSCDGVLVPGGFGSRGAEGKILAARWARKNEKPYLDFEFEVLKCHKSRKLTKILSEIVLPTRRLVHAKSLSGICYGFQIAVIEFARDVLGWEGANSTEIDPNTAHPVVIEMPEHNQGKLGGTMRLGKRKTILRKGQSLTRQLYGNVDYIEERHRHRYEVNPALVQYFEERGLHFVGQDIDGERMEVAELQGHTFYLSVQFHPEFLSRPLKPSPPYLGFLLAASGKLERFLQHGARLSPRSSFNDIETTEGMENLNISGEEIKNENLMVKKSSKIRMDSALS